MPITINGSGTITGASTLATTVASPTFTTPNINSAQFATVSGTAPIYACRAWVNFNGTGTVAIRASGNVTSITDLGIGSYRANFTTAMSDVNYVVEISTGLNASGGLNTTFIDAPATGSVDMSTYAVSGSGAGAYRDTANIYVTIFR